MPVGLVKVPMSQKSIFNIKEVIGLQAVVESLRSTPDIEQCESAESVSGSREAESNYYYDTRLRYSIEKT